MSRVIVVTSGKGGVGKSSISVNLASALAFSKFKVCLIDGDFGLKNLDVMMGLENRVVYDLNDVVEGRCTIEQVLVKDKRIDNIVKEKTVPIHTSIKITEKSKIEKLKNHLLASFTNTSIIEKQSPIYYRLKIQNNDDKFTLTQYETGTLLLQGQSTKLFSDILDKIQSISPLSDLENTLLYVPQENQSQVKNAFDKNKNDFSEIYDLAKKRISSEAFSYLFKNDQQTLVSAIGILEVVRSNKLNIPLYNPILYPFAKVFEGFVIKLLIDKAFFTFDAYKANPEVADIGNALRKKKLKKYIKDTRRNEFVLDKLITTWESLRCHELHSDPAQDDSIINLTDIDQVDNRIGEISGTIIDAYRIIVENGYTEEEMLKNRVQQ